MNRLNLHTFYTKGVINLKTNIFSKNHTNGIKSLVVSAGLYKPSLLTIQHSLILASIVGKPPAMAHQIHGKRKRRTASLNVRLLKNDVFPALSKLTYEILPILSNFKTPKWHKSGQAFSYTLRLRQKFNYYDEFEDLLSNQMYDSYRGVFLPLNININFNNSTSHTNNEIYLRSVHLPVNLFKRRPRPAFDDSVKFE